MNVDLLSVSAHKINGPKGIGFLICKKWYQITPRLFGGEQERKRRAGTENVPAIAGFLEAVKIAQSEQMARSEQYKKFKEILVSHIKAKRY